jgi:DNA-binding transcriptional MerR regulator
MTEGLTVHELAAQVGMTPRNVRAYQSRGLLHPPQIKGRVAQYTGSHVARLGLITSLQSEGFTLAAIKRLLETPHSYAAIVADRRRRFRDNTSDISATVALPLDAIREAMPDLPDDLTETGLVWREGDQLVTHTMLMGIGRSLVIAGMPLTLLARLQLETAQTARVLGQAVREHLASAEDDGRRDDLSKVAVQLAAAAFEIAFLEAARGRSEPASEQAAPAQLAPSTNA